MISKLLTHPISRTFKRVASDPQRSRLYKMEREFAGAAIYHDVTQLNLQMIANHVCRYYGVDPVQVTVYHDSDDTRFGEMISYSYDGETEFGHKIRLNRAQYGANLVTLLHELAHYVCDLHYKNHRGHGRQFTAIYMHLLDKYRLLPSVAFRALAKKWGVKLAGRFKPGAIRG